MTSTSSRIPVAASPLTAFFLAPNPGPMSLDGTNSYVISAPGASTSVVVDPGPADEATSAASPMWAPWNLFW
ncbi:beta-Lactamase [Arthrobacter sp. Hiyo4]|nr:beta-Lactamase [Arthrobacter sp. Hiyo4]